MAADQPDAQPDAVRGETSSAPAPRPLNEHQRRHLYFGLAQIDKLLSEIEGIAAAAGARLLFPRYINDLAPVQRQLLEGSLARLRAALAGLLHSQNMRPDPPRIHASGAIRTTLIFAEIAAEELGPSSMRGYGELDPKQAREVEGVIAELRNRTEALLKELSPEPADQLEARVAALPHSPAARALAALERITRERGMMEFRAGLAQVAERMAAPAMEIAVFGRVSCGKSSLLNYLLGADILPTGATPITAVPTRIGYGAEAAVTAQFERTRETFGVERLAELASERQNPDNRLGVTRLTVTYPSPKLRPGVFFVDTPGLGSIRSWGAMETLAYLPRSDMAILLVDAGSALGGDELELVRWLHQGGIPVQVLLSKADLVEAVDLDAAVRFTAEALQREVRGAMRVRAVSVRRSELADAWFESDVSPLYDSLRQRFQASIERRLQALREAVLAALQAPRGEAGSGAPEAMAGLERQLRLAEAAGDRVRDRLRGLAQQMADAAPAVVAEAAGALEATWRENPELDSAALRGLAGEALGKAMVSHGHEALEALTQLGRTYADTLNAARQILPEPGAEPETFAVRDLPMPEVGTVAWEIARPRFASLGRKYALGQFRAQVATHWEAVAGALRSYGVVLQQQALAAQAEMQRRFAARADIVRAAIQRLSGTLGPEAPLSPDLQAQLDVLTGWRPEAAELVPAGEIQ